MTAYFDVNKIVYRYLADLTVLTIFFSRFIFNQLEALLSVKFVKQKYLKEFMKKKKVWFAGGNTQTNQIQYPNTNLLLR